MPTEKKDEEWLKIYEFQQKAFEETKRLKQVDARKEQVQIRSALSSQMKVGDERHRKAHEIKKLELRKERLEYEQWVAEERQKTEVMKGKIMNEKSARDVQIDARKQRRASEMADRRVAEEEETFKIKAEIQRAKEEAISKKRAEKARLKAVFDDVAEQKRIKERLKEKVAAEDRVAAVQYKEMLDKQDEARKSYFIRKVSNNEAMVKKLDDVFGARERARLKKEEETLERIVRETDTMLKDQAEAKLRNRKEAVNERLATLQAQISQKEQRERREKEMERKAAADMRRMAEKASMEHESKQHQRHQKLMEYRAGLEAQMREQEKKVSFPMTETERRLNSDLMQRATSSGRLTSQDLKRYSTPF